MTLEEARSLEKNTPVRVKHEIGRAKVDATGLFSMVTDDGSVVIRHPEVAPMAYGYYYPRHVHLIEEDT